MISISALQKKAETAAIIAATFAEYGRIDWARKWAEKSDNYWRQWIAAMEAAHV